MVTSPVFQQFAARHRKIAGVVVFGAFYQNEAFENRVTLS